VSGASEDSSAAPLWPGFQRFLLRLCLVLMAVGVLAGSVVFVDETEFVLVERLGVLVAVYDQAEGPGNDRGLHFKLPWPIETVRRFDRRLQLFDPPAREIFTGDRKNITVDTYLCWQIPSGGPETPLLERPVVKFFRSLSDVATSEARLETRVRSILSSELGRLELSELLQATDSETGPEGASPVAELMQRVTQQMQQRADEASPITDRWGIRIVDVGLKRINLPQGNLMAVYERMRKEREKIAQRYRSAGEAEKLVIESQAQKQREELLAQATAEAARIRAEGEAEALRRRNAAYARDPQFAAWLRNLDSYQKLLNEQTTLVLSTTSPWLKLLLEGPDPALPVPPIPAVPGTSATPPIPGSGSGSSPAAEGQP